MPNLEVYHVKSVNTSETDYMHFWKRDGHPAPLPAPRLRRLYVYGFIARLALPLLPVTGCARLCFDGWTALLYRNDVQNLVLSKFSRNVFEYAFTCTSSPTQQWMGQSGFDDISRASITAVLDSLVITASIGRDFLLRALKRSFPKLRYLEILIPCGGAGEAQIERMPGSGWITTPRLSVLRLTGVRGSVEETMYDDSCDLRDAGALALWIAGLEAEDPISLEVVNLPLPELPVSDRILSTSGMTQVEVRSIEETWEDKLSRLLNSFPALQ